MSDSDTTNLLLLLILFVLLIGFGFLVPILWIAGAVIGLWLFAVAISAISRKVREVFEAVSRMLDWIFAPILKVIRSFLSMIRPFLSNDAVHWCFISVIMGLLIWGYFHSGNNEYLFALIIPALFALIKGISYWDTVSIRRKYQKVNPYDP